MPYYDFFKFKKACECNQRNIYLINNVTNDARKIFNLNNKPQILEFISNDGLENLRFINCKAWESNPDKNNPIMVDSYEFRTLGKLGYIAFMRNRENWIIKSFHLSTNTNMTMFDALGRAGLIEEKKT